MKIILLALGLLAGCSTFRRTIGTEVEGRGAGSAEVVREEPKRGPELLHKADLSRQYLFICMEGYAEKYHRSKSTALEIAEAASSNCRPAYEDYKRNLSLYLIEISGWRGAEAADSDAPKTLAQAKDRVIQIVVEKRK